MALHYLGLAFLTLAALPPLAAGGTDRRSTVCHGCISRGEVSSTADTAVAHTASQSSKHVHAHRGRSNARWLFRPELAKESPPASPDSLAIVESDESSSSNSRSENIQEAGDGWDSPTASPTALHPIRAECASVSHPLIYRLHTLLI
jgi:hypothetical protein